ncbi:Uncharacterised protein [Mycobacteroides abscessus]|nr:Uncharacterised protein [Mycobacteroides abscessus]
MFCATVRAAQLPDEAGRNPSCAFSGELTCPESGTTCRTSVRSSVVLPAPSPPTTATTWPAGTSTVTSWSARRSPKDTLTDVTP